MDGLPALTEAGVTDFLVHLRPPDSYAGAQDAFSDLARAFHRATGR